MSGLDFIRAAALSPGVKVGNTHFNSEEIIRLAKEADREGAGILVFPRLCITGNSCGDLLFQEFLYEKQMDGLEKICKETRGIKGVIVLGIWLRTGNTYNACTALLQKGAVLGIVPSGICQSSPQDYHQSLPPGGRSNLQAHSGGSCGFAPSISLFGEQVPFGNLPFRDPENQLILTVETDWNPATPPSSEAHILCSPAADPQIVGEATFRRYRDLMRSREYNCGLVHASAGPHESTTDSVYSGHCLITECGSLLSESPFLSWEGTAIYGDLDAGKIRYRKAREGRCCDGISKEAGNAGAGGCDSTGAEARTVLLDSLPMIRDPKSLNRSYSKTPFIPENNRKAHENCREAFEIQAAALARRVEHTRSRKIVLGISGGLDSTLALMAAVRAFNILGRSPSDIIGITMPGFGTTGKTWQNALALMELLGTESREIPITESVLLHFRDIGHDQNIHNAVYENAQARERTQILMDIANKEGGLQVGTGDLSERALGWCTFNGDHMGMYNVNGGVPKTLIRAILSWFIERRLSGADGQGFSVPGQGLSAPEGQEPFSADDRRLAKILQDILDTPISPELFPPDAQGNITQKTEDSVGPYRLHDFFLYHSLRNGAPPKKLLALAAKTFADEYEEDEIRKWLKEYYRRFFSQQFKRNCSPDGPRIGSVGLSPRGEWNMPSDMDGEIWLQEL